MEYPHNLQPAIGSLEENDILFKRNAQQSREQLVSLPANTIKLRDLKALPVKLIYKIIRASGAIDGNNPQNLFQVINGCIRQDESPSHRFVPFPAS